jgi:surface carbohydrate biosynthesis protein
VPLPRSPTMPRTRPLKENSSTVTFVPQMPMTKPLLLIPVENQVRELDPKLLLACIAARRGFSSIIGSRREMEMLIDQFPRSIYLSKSMTVRSLLFFWAASKFGHDIITWDEEALVHLPPETYFSRRLHPAAIRHVSHLFAWGEDNAELWRQYPALPARIPIHVTGNPRGDLLRPELHAYYAAEMEAIRKEYGHFILINTNFNQVNAFGPDMNLFKPVKKAGQKPRFGRAARGMSRAYAEGLRDHKQAVFADFQRIIPELEKSFPNYTIVIRPHPTESHEIYREIAARCQRVRVTNEGNVVPWLLCAKALVHNGCTTGVEAFVMRIPAVSFRATVNEIYDNGFYRLPNALSHQCFTFEELRETLRQILEGDLGSPDGDGLRRILQHHLAGQDGSLACERVVDVLDKIATDQFYSPAPGRMRRCECWVITRGLRLLRRIKSKLPGSHNRPEFQRHRYPGIPMEEFQSRMARFQRLLGDGTRIEVEPVTATIYRLYVA